MSSNLKTKDRTVPVWATAMWLACVWAASSALANDQVRTETVRFADLNVTSPAGVETLQGRIHAAAERVCYQPDDRQREAAKLCATKAEREAIAHLKL